MGIGIVIGRIVRSRSPLDDITFNYTLWALNSGSAALGRLGIKGLTDSPGARYINVPGSTRDINVNSSNNQQSRAHPVIELNRPIEEQV